MGWKKHMLFFLAACAVLGMAGCGESFGDGESQGKNSHMEFAKERLYQEQIMKLDGREVVNYTAGGGCLYVVTDEIGEDGRMSGKQHLYSVNPDGTDRREISLENLPGNYTEEIVYGADGNLVLRREQLDEDWRSEEQWLVRIDTAGNLLAQQDITDSLHESYAMYNMTADKEGRVYFCYMEYLYLFHADLTFAREVKPNFTMDSVGYTKDGTVICAGADSAEKFVCTLDFETGEFGKRYRTGTDEVQISAGCPETAAYDFYFTNSYGGYGYDLEQEKSTYLFDYQMSALYQGDFVKLQALGDGQFAAIESAGDWQLAVLSQGDMAEWENKTVLTYGLASSMAREHVEQMVTEFNRKNDTCRIEIKDYSEEEDPQTAFNLDIISGNIPDIIALDDLPADQYIAKGLLEDLTPYYEKDTDVSTEDLLDSVVEATKVDGKIYYVTPSFMVYSMLARKSDVGERDGITFGEIKDILAQKEEKVQPFHAGGEKVNMLFAFLSTGYSDFIDWETGTCRFDSQDFKDILEICNRDSSLTEYEYSDGWGLPALLRQGIVLFSGTSVNLEELQLYRGLYQDEIAVVGYPCETRDGSYFECSTRMGISADSENKEAAWEFLKEFQKKEFQESIDMVRGEYLPVRKDAFELYIQTCTASEDFTDETGRSWAAAWSARGIDGVEVEIGPAPEEDVELFRNLIAGTHRTVERNPAVDEIIEDAVKAYFAGFQSLDKTAGEIQTRVTTYVNESR
ncbi:MAG: extracellular solute-binding protein [Clostridium sp.]|nr:extracellular solute-binding protein [Clostridium sp.]